MLDSMYQEGTDKTLDDRVSRPLQAPTARPSFGASLWNTTKAPFAGVGAGANESAGFAADILGAFGSVQAGYGLQADPSLLFSGDEQKKRIEAGQKARDEIESGAAFSTEIGTGFRATSRSFAPDPATANAAEQMLFGFSRLMTKAVGYSVLGGPIVGATLTGADEGMTDADRLKAEGVDIATRTKAGAVAGVSTGLSVALPVAGKTFAGTAALVAAGGPVSFIAQQAASKAILENAGYDKLADQYNPFDPVGLAVSTLVPAAFGAYAMRGAKAQPKPIADPAAARVLADMGGNERLAMKYDDARLDAYAVTAAQREGIPPEVLLAIKNAGEKSGPTAVSPKGAKGVMQFMDATWAAYGKGDPRDPVASIDAGARYMKDLIKQYDGDVRAAIAHYNGGGKAGAAVKAGELAPALETRKYLGRTEAYVAESRGTEAGRAAANDPEVVAAARVALVREAIDSTNLHAAGDIRGADDHLTAVMKAGEQIAAGERVDVSGLIATDRIAADRLQTELVDRISIPDYVTTQDKKSMSRAIRSSSDLMADRNIPAEVKQRLQEASIQLMKSENKAYVAAVDIARKSGEVDAETVAQIHQMMVRRQGGSEAPSGKSPTPAKQAVSELKPAKAASKPGEPASITPESASKGPESVSDQPAAASKPQGEGNAAAGAFDAQTAEIARLSPDLMVQLEGMDKPIRLADALEAVKAEAAREAQDAPLLQVAAECFLRSA